MKHTASDVQEHDRDGEAIAVFLASALTSPHMKQAGDIGGIRRSGMAAQAVGRPAARKCPVPVEIQVLVGTRVPVERVALRAAEATVETAAGGERLWRQHLVRAKQSTGRECGIQL